VPSAIRKRIMDYDRFTKVFPPPNGVLEDDLFAGIA
jgi:hypothetical protein